MRQLEWLFSSFSDCPNMAEQFKNKKNYILKMTYILIDLVRVKVEVVTDDNIETWTSEG